MELAVVVTLAALGKACLVAKRIRQFRLLLDESF